MSREHKFLMGVISLVLVSTFLASELSAGEAARVFLFEPLVVNIRSGRSIEGTVIRQVDEDSPMVAFVKEEGWYNVRLADGDEGWVWWPLVRPLPQRQGFITAGSFVWASRKEEGNRVLTEVLGNVSLPIIESAPGPWFRVELPDGGSGWVWGEIGVAEAKGVGEPYRFFRGRTPPLIAAQGKLEEKTVDGKTFFQVKREVVSIKPKPTPAPEMAGKVEIGEKPPLKSSLAELVSEVEYPQEIDFGDLQVGSEVIREISVKFIPQDVALGVVFEEGGTLSLQGDITELAEGEKMLAIKALSGEEEGEQGGSIILRFQTEGEEETRSIAYRMNVMPQEVEFYAGIFPQKVNFGDLKVGERGEPQEVNVVVNPPDAKLTIEPDPSEAIAISSNIDDRGQGEFIVTLTPLARKAGEHAGELFVRFELPNSSEEELEKIVYEFTASSSLFSFSGPTGVIIIGGGLIVIALILILVLRNRRSASRSSRVART